MTVEVKICGLNDAAGLDAAVVAGADLLGFVFVAASPRVVAPAAAAALAARAPRGPLRVGLFADAEDAAIAAVLASLPLDLLQLHGDEDPRRCRAVRERFGLPVMKALGIADAADVRAIDDWTPAVDRLLLDAKPPPGAVLPGGNARAFDWGLLAGVRVARPWLLAGGLNAGNVARAIAASGAPGVDVSSGVERTRGVKDPALIAEFVAAARGSAPAR